MEQFYEDRTTYDPAKDRIATVTFTVECNPKAVPSVVAAMKQIIKSTAVYFAAYESATQPMPVAAPQGNEHAEQPIQQLGAGETDGRDSQDAETGIGLGSVSEHDGAELAGAAGEDRA